MSSTNEDNIISIFFILSSSYKDEYKFFNDMTFFEENSDSICEAGYLFHTSEKSDEILIVPKTNEKQGFFEKLFYYFSR